MIRHAILSVHVMLDGWLGQGVVDLGSQGPGADIAFNKGVALQGPIPCHLSAALAIAVGVVVAGHALTAIFVSIHVALLGVFF